MPQLEDSDRKRIQQEKDDERNKAMEELEMWKEHQEQLAEEVQITEQTILITESSKYHCAVISQDYRLRYTNILLLKYYLNIPVMTRST